MVESLRVSPEVQQYSRIASFIRATFPKPKYRAEGELDAVLVHSLLDTIPQREKHMLAELNFARNIAPHLKRDREFMRDFEQAALLHDIGYAEKLKLTGFHPLDGAIFLAHHGASDRVVCAVLFHSAARELSQILGQDSPAKKFYEQISNYSLTFFDRALEVVDLHTSPFGKRVSLEQRIEEICTRPEYKGTQLPEVMVKLYPNFRKSRDLILLTGGLPVRNLLPMSFEQSLKMHE